MSGKIIKLIVRCEKAKKKRRNRRKKKSYYDNATHIDIGLTFSTIFLSTSLCSTWKGLETHFRKYTRWREIVTGCERFRGVSPWGWGKEKRIEERKETRCFNGNLNIHSGMNFCSTDEGWKMYGTYCFSTVSSSLTRTR